MEFEVGNKIQIGKEKFDVLNVTEEIDKWDSKKDKLIGEHLAIELHKFRSSSLHPTHLLKIYKDRKMILYEIIQEKIITPLAIRLKQRGGIFSYINPREISMKEVKQLIEF
jgi:hypothetical protein